MEHVIRIRKRNPSRGNPSTVEDHEFNKKFRTDLITGLMENLSQKDVPLTREKLEQHISNATNVLKGGKRPEPKPTVPSHQNLFRGLNKYGTDLTEMAAKGKLDPVIGREDQVEHVVQILCKRKKNNACLIGDPGVGKTVIAEGLAQRIVNATVPQELLGKKIFSIEMSRLIAGTSLRGQFEEKLTLLIDEVKQSCGEIILFIDELHTIIGTGTAQCSSLDAANILKPALARGELKCIGATTRDEYKKFMERDLALKRRFRVVEVPESSIDETIEILRGLQSKYEMHHNVKYEDEALIASAKLSKQYISDGYLPDKAIDLMDEAGSRVQSYHSRTSRKSRVRSHVPPGRKSEVPARDATAVVTKDHIRQIISFRTGIPIQKVSQEESVWLLDMVNILQKNIIGQDKAIQAVTCAIRRARVGLKDPSRPVASFLFTGPTGVGKTLVAKLLAQEYIGSKEAMVRLDMSEYMEKHSVSRLFGSPPGYNGHMEGGHLTEAIRSRPHNIILFDEIEKAHQDIFNSLLQILDDGRLTDGKGRVVDFKQTIIIMTSNIGFDSSSYDRPEVKDDEVALQLKKAFRPEFLNRLDEIIIFKKLGKIDLMKVLDIMLEEVCARIQMKNITLEFSKKFKEKLLSESCGDFNTSMYGARPLRRAITRHLEDKLAEGILNGNIKEGESLIVDVDSKDQVLLSLNIQEKRKKKRQRLLH